MSEEPKTTVALMKQLVGSHSETEREFSARLEAECEEVLEQYKRQERLRVQSMLSSERCAPMA